MSLQKPGFIGPDAQRLLNTLRVPVLSIKGVIVHSPGIRLNSDFIVPGKLTSLAW